MRVIVAVFGPIVMAVEFIVKKVLRLFGVDIKASQNVLSAHAELRGAIDLHHKEGGVVPLVSTGVPKKFQKRLIF